MVAGNYKMLHTEEPALLDAAFLLSSLLKEAGGCL